MALTYDKLPAKLRAQVDEAIGKPAKKPARGKGGGTVGGRGPWRCAACREISTTWAAAQRHADENAPGHGRIECVLHEAAS